MEDAIGRWCGMRRFARLLRQIPRIELLALIVAVFIVHR